MLEKVCRKPVFLKTIGLNIIVYKVELPDSYDCSQIIASGNARVTHVYANTTSNFRSLIGKQKCILPRNVL